MTTIVYSHEHKEIAFDSRASRGGDIVTDDYNKLYKSNGVQFIISGSPADAEVFIAMYEDPELRAIPEIDAIVVDEGKVYSVHPTEEGELSCFEAYFDIGAGSGSPWAIAALDHGKTPRQAVKYAATRDLYTGGKIHVIKVK